MGKETSTEPALPSRIYGINQQKPPSLLGRRIKNTIAAGACAIAAAGTAGGGAWLLLSYYPDQDAQVHQDVFCRQPEIASIGCENSSVQNLAGEIGTVIGGLTVLGITGFAAYQFGSRAIRP